MATTTFATTTAIMISVGTGTAMIFAVFFFGIVLLITFYIIKKVPAK